ncbi:MAG: diaminopimelate epimerase [Candidatus Omnitrophica bacterium]|nr:diaminopimelate epimerase [Candidatus Omnitrophota bacterium]
MKKLSFTKMVASGNDFVVVDAYQGSSASGYRDLAKKVCDRKFGIGADGLLVLSKSKLAKVRMRIFNADGSEAEMCGNGARCAALYTGKKNVRLETLAGIIEAIVSRDLVKIKLTDPYSLKLDLPVKIGSRSLWVNFINTGVPHAVIFVDGLENIDVHGLGRHIRNHKEFSPKGTNVNFIEVLDNDSIAIRTYERGVEAETLACGTGSTASALVFALRAGINKSVKVHTRSGEVLKVYFNRVDDEFSDVWLEGNARIVYKGECHV